jgi:hypothetical protein
MEDLIAAQVAAAKGIKYLVKRDENGRFQRIGPEGLDDPEGIYEVWQKDPSTAAFTDLMNRALDKPKEQVQEVVVSHSEKLLERLDAWKRENRARKLAALEQVRDAEVVADCGAQGIVAPSRGIEREDE